jgi:RNA exonuclease 4
LTEVIAIDCEMVGGGENGRENLLARVSVVNSNGETLYDAFVKPINDIPVTDYRTKYSGVRPADLVNGNFFHGAIV